MAGQSTIKVLQIASSGMEFFHEQVRVLREMGIECDVLYYPPNSRNHEYIHDGFLGWIYGHNPLYYAIRGLLYYPYILQTTLKTDYDIVHINSGMVAPLGLLQPQRPVVLTLWGDDLLGDRLAGYQSSITKLCAQFSDSIIVRSQEMQEELPCEAAIIPSGVDLSKFKPMSRSESREVIGWSHTDYHVLFPYVRTQKKKRYHVAEQVVANVNNRLDKSIKLHEVSDTDHDEMPLYYNAANVLLLPSLREGSPNTVKEAMACNIPVVSTDVGDVRERLGPVTNSYVCSDDSELEDALISVLKINERSDGRDHLSELSLDRMGERIISIYESLIDETMRGT